MPRILVSEELAESGLAKMRAAGHDVDVRVGLSPEELREAIKGAHALVVRSATDVMTRSSRPAPTWSSSAVRASVWTTSTSRPPRAAA